MGQIIREVCVVSVLCALTSSIAPEGGTKKMMSICCSVILMLIMLKPLIAFDMELYAQSLARYREMEAAFDSKAQDISARLNRLVIEDEYRTYIMDKAEKNDVNIISADVKLEWNTEGYWVPCSVELNADDTPEKLEYISSFLQTELGIAEERQCWVISP